MADEIRRSGRATKGQHNKLASSSPAPNPKPAAKASKAKTTTSKKRATAAAAKKSSVEPQQPEAEDEGEDDEKIRCVCGNDDPEDNRTFISCDACLVWQHNVCMGITDEDDDTPEHYFCEECRPEEHQETLQAMKRGEKIWETRIKIMKNEKKSKKRKSKGPPGWLKKEVAPVEEEGEEEKVVPEEEAVEETPAPAAPAAATTAEDSVETGSKRKREEVKEDDTTQEKTEMTPSVAQKNEKAPDDHRADKRRKQSSAEKKSAADVDTALVKIDQLPQDRRKVAESLSKIMAADVLERVKAGFKLQKDQTPESVGDHHAVRIEYSLHMNYDGQAKEKYSEQFRAIFSNMKRNKLLIERLLHGSLTADELSTMSSADMASENLQREMAAMKAENARLATLPGGNQGPRMRRTHKGDEVIEDENNTKFEAAPAVAAVREREDTEANTTSHPGDQSTPTIDTSGPSADPRRGSDQQFNMSDIWAKTAQSPTQPNAVPRPLQQPARRRSSFQVNKQQVDGTREDAEVDRLLRDEDDDEPYSPTENHPNGDASLSSYRGKIIASSTDATPTTSATFMAGRDIGAQAWLDLLPPNLAIEGRLGISKAEDYLCGLQWSKTSDVAVLALRPSNESEQTAFDELWEYFRSRERYAVVAREKPMLVKDCYLIPLEAGAVELPPHVEMLEHCLLPKPVGKRILLATFVLSRASNQPDTITAQQQDGGISKLKTEPSISGTPNANGHLPPHLRQNFSTQGPSGSPIAPTTSTNPVQTAASPFPPNLYTTQTTTESPTQPQPTWPQHQDQQQQQQQQQQQIPPPQFQPQFQQQQQQSPIIAQILGPFVTTPTAQQIVAADPAIQAHKLQHLRNILERSVPARTELRVLMEELGVVVGAGSAVEGQTM